MSLEACDFECAVCSNLLLDPVVGPCGHDFCKECLESWKAISARGRRGNCAACPICRKPLPNELGVCLRLRETLQTLFPDKMKERRAEVEQRRAAAAAVAAATATANAHAPAAASTNRRQASGIPGVHRSNIPWNGSSSFGAGSSASGGTSHPFGSPFGPAFFGAAAMSAVGGPAVAQAAAAAAAATTNTAALPTPAPAVATWTYSGALCFSLGWHDPNENRGRRSWGRRRRAVAV